MIEKCCSAAKLLLKFVRQIMNIFVKNSVIGGFKKGRREDKRKSGVCIFYKNKYSIMIYINLFLFLSIVLREVIFSMFIGVRHHVMDRYELFNAGFRVVVDPHIHACLEVYFHTLK